MSEHEPAGYGSDAVATPPPEATDRFPWPPAEDESIVSAFSRTWQGASLRPRDFFARMPEHDSLGAAVIYYLAIGIAAAGAMLFFRMIMGPPDDGTASLLTELGLVGGWNPLVDFLFSPIMLLLSLFVSAGVTHVLLLLFRGATRSYTFTTRVFAFAYSPQILGIVPYVGTVIGFIWMVGVAIIGLSAGHRTTTGRAAAAVLVPLFVAFTFVAIAAFIAAAMSVAV